MDRRRFPNQLDFPFDTLGRQAQRVVEGLRPIYEKPEELEDGDGRARERSHQAGEGEGIEAHQPRSVPRAMKAALEVAFRPAFEQRRRATRAEFKGWNGKPKRRRK